MRTEPDYFHGMRRLLNMPSIEVKRKGVSPEQLIDEAARYREYCGADFDEVWCVTDVDDFPIARACQVAPRRGVDLAISNPCFELWLLLHFCDRWTAAQDYAEVAQQLKKYVPSYNKASLDFEIFAEGIPDAIRRAKRLGECNEKPYSNPSTTMWRLVESIMENKT